MACLPAFYVCSRGENRAMCIKARTGNRLILCLRYKGARSPLKTLGLLSLILGFMFPGLGLRGQNLD